MAATSTGEPEGSGGVSLISLSQRARKERLATLLRDWSPTDRRKLGRLLARFNGELTRDIGRGA